MNWIITEDQANEFIAGKIVINKEVMMTNINLDTVELKKANVTAVVADKQISVEVKDKEQAAKADAAKEVPFTV